jgi:hypothetical protein
MQPWKIRDSEAGLVVTIPGLRSDYPEEEEEWVTVQQDAFGEDRGAGDGSFSDCRTRAAASSSCRRRVHATAPLYLVICWKDRWMLV